MKKFFVLILALSFVITCLTACTSTNTPSSQPTQTEETTETSVDFDEVSLVKSYCDGSWDGSFISDTEHCASIENGKLWIDCSINSHLPDMGQYENSLWNIVLKSSEDGTWVYDRQIGTVEFWKQGIRIHKVVLTFKEAFVTEVYALPNCIVAKNRHTVKIFKFNGYDISTINEVIDIYQEPSSPNLKISNFSHENIEINEYGEQSLLTTHYIRFPRENIKLQETENSSTLKEIVDLYKSGWTGNFKVIDSKYYVLVDFYGDVYVNNRLVGNIHGAEFSKHGCNIQTSSDHSYYWNGQELVCYRDSSVEKIPLSEGDGKIIWVDNNYGIVILIYGETPTSNKLYIVRDKAIMLSENVSDANVAYDTIYYMEGNIVYSVDWKKPEAKPSIFCKGAYAVSERTDELEGAIVPSELNNMEEYEEYNLYSPYGTKK